MGRSRQGRRATMRRAWWVGALALTVGGCTCAERYDGFLGSVKDGLKNDVRPKYEAALRAQKRDERFIANDLALLDEIIQSVADVQSGAKDPATTKVAGGKP